MKMNITLCDRCNKITKWELTGKLSLDVSVRKKLGLNITYFDLCEDCLKDLVEFFNLKNETKWLEKCKKCPHNNGFIKDINNKPIGVVCKLKKYGSLAVTKKEEMGCLGEVNE